MIEWAIYEKRDGGLRRQGIYIGKTVEEAILSRADKMGAKFIMGKKMWVQLNREYGSFIHGPYLLKPVPNPSYKVEKVND